MKHRPRLLWKTTTSYNGDDPHRDEVLERADRGAKLHAPPHFGVYDVRALTRQLQRQHLKLNWDELHYLCVVYEQMNDVLLNMLCDEEEEDLRFSGEER